MCPETTRVRDLIDKFADLSGVWAKITHFFGQLIRSNLFSYDAYLKRVLSLGLLEEDGSYVICYSCALIDSP